MRPFSGFSLNQSSHSLEKAEITILRDQGRIRFFSVAIVETTHLFLLLVMLGAAGGILACVLRLVLRGVVALRPAGSGAAGANMLTFSDSSPDGINWREINALPSPATAAERARTVRQNRSQALLPKTLYRRLFRWRAWLRSEATLAQSSFPAIQQVFLADPVDGTLFQAGEDVVRCACGTSYHTHSWQWLAEKNDAKCLSCKRAGMATSTVGSKIAG